VEQAWAAVNAAKAFEVKSATAADILRARDGGWQVGQMSGWGAFGAAFHASGGRTAFRAVTSVGPPTSERDVWPVATAPTGPCADDESFQRFYVRWQGVEITEDNLENYLLDASGVRLTIPASVDGKTCGPYVSCFWTPDGTVDECPAPSLGATSSQKTCDHNGDEVDHLIGQDLGPQFEDVFGGNECSATFKQFMRRCWCMLFENLDIVEWAVCTCIGDTAVFNSLRQVLSGERYVLMTCDQSNVPFIAEAVLDIRWHEATRDVKNWLAAYDSGDRDQRLCAVIRGAGVLFHELLHVVGGGADFWLEFAKSHDLPIDADLACNPVWLAHSALRTGLMMRFPRSRMTGRCDSTLDSVYLEVS